MVAKDLVSVTRACLSLTALTNRRLTGNLFLVMDSGSDNVGMLVTPVR